MIQLGLVFAVLVGGPSVFLSSYVNPGHHTFLAVLQVLKMRVASHPCVDFTNNGTIQPPSLDYQAYACLVHSTMDYMPSVRIVSKLHSTSASASSPSSSASPSSSPASSSASSAHLHPHPHPRPPLQLEDGDETILNDLRRTVKMASGFAAPYPLETFADMQEVSINGVRAVWITPNIKLGDPSHPHHHAHLTSHPRHQAIVYMHGGAYIANEGSVWSAILTACDTGLRTLAIDYSLAPEHPLPFAIDQVMEVWRYLLEQGYEPHNLMLAGDSAGGGMAVLLMQRLRDEGMAQPAGSILFSPWTDLTQSGESQQSGRLDPMIMPTPVIERWSLMAVGYQRELRASPKVSPLFGNMTGLAPMVVIAGGNELLLSDSTRLAEAARNAGVSVDLVVVPGMCHIFGQLRYLFDDGLAASSNAIERFVKQRLQVNPLAI